MQIISIDSDCNYFTPQNVIKMEINNSNLIYFNRKYKFLFFNNKFLLKNF